MNKEIKSSGVAASSISIIKPGETGGGLLPSSRPYNNKQGGIQDGAHPRCHSRGGASFGSLPFKPYHSVNFLLPYKPYYDQNQVFETLYKSSVD